MRTSDKVTSAPEAPDHWLRDLSIEAVQRFVDEEVGSA